MATQAEAMKSVAADCQRLARVLAPRQNWGPLWMPPAWAWAALRKLFRRPHARAQMTSREVSEVTSALLSAGNMLERAGEYAARLEDEITKLRSERCQTSAGRPT